MNFVKLTLLLISSLYVIGCASTHGAGNYAEPLSLSKKGQIVEGDFQRKVVASKRDVTPKGLLLSGSENRALSSEYFTLLDFTFQNKSGDWLRIKKVELDFGNPIANSEIRFPVGSDLAEWARSAHEVKAINDYNIDMALAVIGAAGEATARHGTTYNVAEGGARVGTGAGMILAARNISENLDALQRARVIPQDHLLSGPVIVPPGLHSRKWITLYASNPHKIPFVDRVGLILTYENDQKEALMIPIRNMVTTGSKFQLKHPDVVRAKALAAQR